MTEDYSCAYDELGNVTFCGTQDNGVVEQIFPGLMAWLEPGPFDGGIVAMSDVKTPCPLDALNGGSTRYLSGHFFKYFDRQECNVADLCTESHPALIGPNGSLKCTDPEDDCPAGVVALTPLAANPFAPDRLIVAADRLYESFDGGQTLVVVKGLTERPREHLLTVEETAQLTIQT